MKGLYIIWPDFDYIDKAIESGIDTLLVTFHSLPDDSNPGDYFDTFDQSKAVLQRYKNCGLQLIAVYNIYSYWANYGSDECFVVNNKSYPKGFCPVNENVINRIITPFQELIDQGFCHKVIWDVEHYEDTPHIYPEKIKCECINRCKNLSWEDQWKTRSNILKMYPWSIGQLCYNSWWSMSCYNNTSNFLAEVTYDEPKGKKFGVRFDLWKNKFLSSCFHGVKYNIVPGAFLELFPSTDDFISYLNWLKSHWPYNGYWIYTQKMMSKYSKMDEKNISDIEKMYDGFYQRKMLDEVDPNFFKKLKEIN